MLSAPAASAARQEPGWFKRYRIPLIVVLIGILAFVVWKKLSISVTFAPYEANYTSKPDFAQIEHEYPLNAKQLMSVTPENIRTLDQEKVDQI